MKKLLMTAAALVLGLGIPASADTFPMNPGAWTHPYTLSEYLSRDSLTILGFWDYIDHTCENFGPTTLEFCLTVAGDLMPDPPNESLLTSANTCSNKAEQAHANGMEAREAAAQISICQIVAMRAALRLGQPDRALVEWQRVPQHFGMFNDEEVFGNLFHAIGAAR